MKRHEEACNRHVWRCVWAAGAAELKRRERAWGFGRRGIHVSHVFSDLLCRLCNVGLVDDRNQDLKFEQLDACGVVVAAVEVFEVWGEDLPY